MHFSRLITAALCAGITIYSLSLKNEAQADEQDRLQYTTDYLKTIKEKEAEVNPSPLNGQFRAWYWAILSDEQKAYDAFCETETIGCNVKSVKEKPGRASLAQMIAASSQKNIFILNEAHHASRHRAYATKLLPLLKEQGYTHLAVEALEFLTRERLEAGEYPNTAGNLYLQDPHFAEMLATAYKLGFTLIEYEQTEEQRAACLAENQTQRINCREMAQAENILNVISSDKALKKTVIYVGFNHANLCSKETEFGLEKRLAHLLKEQFPGQVMSVTQTGDFAPKAEIDAENPLVFKQIRQDGDICQTFEVIHAEHQSSHNRDSWLFSLAGRHPVTIDIPEAYRDKEITVRAHYLGTDIEAEYADTAVDQFVVKGEKATLALNNDDFVVSILSENSIMLIGEISAGKFKPLP